MTNQKTTQDSRILSEMLEMAHALQVKALITKQDMAKMSQSVFASILNVSVSA